MKFFTPHQIEKITQGYFSDVYFNRTREILLQENNFKRVVMQIFQRREKALLCGVEEVRELLSLVIGHLSLEREIIINSRKDGEWVRGGESVMHITGPYAYFAHLESVYLGILARRTLVATNTRCAVDAANGKPVIFFAARFDYFLNQPGDGYAAKTGGAQGVSTGANAMWINKTPIGTLPHSFIAICNGNTVRAAELFSKYYPNENLITLVDFENDCVRTSLAVAKKLGKKLWGVRIDTSPNLIDKSLKNSSDVILGNPVGVTPESELKIDSGRARTSLARMTNLSGVNPTLVKLVRKALDQEGFSYVKIIVSGGFDADKISYFEKEKTPVDIYGVGSALVKGNNDFTADIVKVEGNLVAKEGRKFKKITKITN